MPPTLLSTLSTEAFSSLWYWVLLAIVWSRATNAPMGFPLDFYDSARQSEESDDSETFALIRLSVARQIGIWAQAGPMLVGGWMFVLSGLLVISVTFRIELAQALLCLLVPLALMQALVLRTAHQMWTMSPEVEPLLIKIKNLRRKVQVLALLAIFVTALYGMVFNLRNAFF
ncbi:MAG: hypothetical protein AAGF71_03825 [Pseudomonadota bacterium]